jgi:hypothetical protein
MSAPMPTMSDPMSMAIVWLACAVVVLLTLWRIFCWR